MKSRRKTSNLYYKPTKHAPIRVFAAYGVFLGGLLVIVFGLSHYLTRVGEKIGEPSRPKSDVSRQELSRAENNASTTDSRSEEIASPESLKSETIDDNVGSNFSGSEALTSNKETDEAKESQSAHVSAKTWFYSEIGLSPVGSAQSESADGKFTLLLMASSKLPEAQKYRDELAKQGLHAFVQKIKPSNGKPKYLVQFGVFRSKRKAGSEKNRLAIKFSVKSEVAPLEL